MLCDMRDVMVVDDGSRGTAAVCATAVECEYEWEGEGVQVVVVLAGSAGKNPLDAETLSQFVLMGPTR